MTTSPFGGNLTQDCYRRMGMRGAVEKAAQVLASQGLMKRLFIRGVILIFLSCGTILSLSQAPDLNIVQLPSSPQPIPTVKKMSEESSPIKFILFLGLEGTGHHYWNSLIKESPVLERMKRVGLYPGFTRLLTDQLYRHQDERWKGLWSSTCKWSQIEQTANVTDLVRQVVETLTTMKDRVAQFQLEHPSESREPLHFPLNLPETNFKNFGVASYPMFLKPCRSLQYPILDVWYQACDAAKVGCEHVYIHRDPYAVIRSTVDNYKFSKERLESIHLYTGILHILYAQLSLHPGRIAGCWNYDDALSKTFLSEHVNPILKFKSHEALLETSGRLYKAKPSLSQTEKERIVPPELAPYMNTMVKTHEAVVQLCRAIQNQRAVG